MMTLDEAKEEQKINEANIAQGLHVDRKGYLKDLISALEENEKLRKVSKQVIEIMESFKYESDEDSPAYSYFEGRILEDHFFIVLNELKNLCGKK